MSHTPENPESGTQPGTTRIVAGETGKPKRKRTLEIALVAGLLWSHIGPEATFLIGGAIGLVGTAIFTLRK